ncbi:unnamed protein product [Prunus armeniaca]|uniref:Uncharacterized protein n=1 Tax=Prunus armeniaca TaxID=36596 RepID=A0A6J5XYN5_PRUAR|nr:unnamed protein product [Prunus armeniaca]
MPDHILDDIWKDVQDNTDVPYAYRSHCLKVVGNKWGDWKCRLTKYETNEEHLAITPAQVPTDQWKILVKYWGLPDVKGCSKANKANCALRSAPHRIGRTSFAKNQFNQYLEEREEHEQDEDYREEVSTKVMGLMDMDIVSDIKENSIREELERQYQSQIDDLSLIMNLNLEISFKYEDLSSQIHLMKAHVGFQVNPTESGSGHV